MPVTLIMYRGKEYNDGLNVEFNIVASLLHRKEISLLFLLPKNRKEIVGQIPSQ